MYHSRSTQLMHACTQSTDEQPPHRNGRNHVPPLMTAGTIWTEGMSTTASIGIVSGEQQRCQQELSGARQRQQELHQPQRGREGHHEATLTAERPDWQAGGALHSLEDNLDATGGAQEEPITNDADPAAVPPPADHCRLLLAHRSISPGGATLHIRTNVNIPAVPKGPAPIFLYESPALTLEPKVHHAMTSPSSAPILGSSLRSTLSTSSIASSTSPGSALPSPYLAAMNDLTPLPSPITGSTNATPPWRITLPGTPNRSRHSSLDDPPPTARILSSSTSPPKRKKGYGSIMQETAISNAVVVQENPRTSGEKHHARHRSISDFVPETLQNVRQRVTTFGSGDASGLEAQEYHMHREAYLAAQRGITRPLIDTSKPLPTPPPSASSMAESDDMDDEQLTLEDGTATEYLEIHCGIHNKRRKFRQLRQLGQGTFSTVMLATRQSIPAHPTPEIEDTLDPHQLVAVKIIENGPAGGADEQRVETGLKREVEMLKSISHPSLIHLRACEYQETRALLVLTYCPGGDLFELASGKRDMMTPAIVQRMFAELVSAVQYLHAQEIVHRDIKLENVLVNLPEAALRAIGDPSTHPTPLVTLTDLGLGRRIPQPPEPPLLQTRCGSEDYAAPEILLGQPYDGRLTDSWALGVLLYALMEGRLPFDAPPGKPDRSRNTHRIARCDWIWCRFGDDDGEWDATRGREWQGAQLCVEGLLKKVRMGRKSLKEIAAMPWVEQGIQIPGGLKMRQEDEDALS